MLRFQEAKNGQEQIRFWHRLFREYLSASRLAQEDSTADQKVMKLWQEKRLTDPFWEDVVRLLPRTLGTIEKARSVRQRLEALADQNPKERGRLLGLAAAGVIENRDLFPDIDSIALTASLAHTFEKEADSWSPIDRILLLECIGRLDPKGGDPRLRVERWVEVKSAGAFAIHVGSAPKTLSLAFSWAPTSVQEFREFLISSDAWSESLWDDAPASIRAFSKSTLQQRISRQLRHPNSPVTETGFYEAVAYCKWRTGQRSDGKTIRLPLTTEWARLESTNAYKSIAQKQEQAGSGMICNCVEAGLHRPSPVGSFPLKICGLSDLLGNVWEWLLPAESPGRSRAAQDVPEPEPAYPVAGGGFDTPLGAPRVTLPPGPFSREGYESIGFRCVLSDAKVDVSKCIASYRRDWMRRHGETEATPRAPEG
jgi:hypothetical protein